MGKRGGWRVVVVEYIQYSALMSKRGHKTKTSRTKTKSKRQGSLGVSVCVWGGGLQMIYKYYK